MERFNPWWMWDAPPEQRFDMIVVPARKQGKALRQAKQVLQALDEGHTVALNNNGVIERIIDVILPEGCK